MWRGVGCKYQPKLNQNNRRVGWVDGGGLGTWGLLGAVAGYGESLLFEPNTE